MSEEVKSLEMARALYSFKATMAKTLSFREHETFLIHHPSTKERRWWQVINSKAQVGYVPSNYVSAIEVTAEFMGEFLDDVIEKIRCEGDGIKDLPDDREGLLSLLISRRRNLNGEVTGADENALSRTPSIISIPPVPSHGPQVQQQAPPVPSHAAPPIPKHADVAPPVPSHGIPSTCDVPKEKPVPAEKTVSVKRRVAELTGQMNSDGNTGTIKRTGSKSLDRKEMSRKPYVQSTPTHQPVKAQEVVGKKPVDEKPAEKIPERSSSRRGSVQQIRGINEETVYQLVEQVRCHTDLSHERSRVGVGIVLASLEKHIPDHPVLCAMLNILQNPLRAPKPLLEQTHDAQRLHVIFTELTSCKDDAQQRSWMLHEDEQVIIDYIKELTNILTDGDATVCQHVVRSTQYAGVLALIDYYQMETRWSIRQPLLVALGVLCGLDRGIVSILLTSVLPCELARDMMDNPDSLARLNFSGLLLVMIFSMGEPMPITHFEHIGVDFLCFVLHLIENPPATDVHEKLPDLFITLLLSYNLQFESNVDNMFVKALAKRETAKTFTEKILVLLNREDDPARVLDHLPPPPHSVLKLFIDVFSCSATAGLFYTNDVKVLIDIIVRQLADLSPGDSRRSQYLALCRVVMRNPSYAEHHHRRDDFLKCFTRIFCEETDESREDQRLVREISNEFPQYFKA